MFERFGTVSSVHLRAKPGNVTAEERQVEGNDFRPPTVSPVSRDLLDANDYCWL